MKQLDMRSHKPKTSSNTRLARALQLEIGLIAAAALIFVALPPMSGAHAGAATIAAQGSLFIVTTTDDHDDGVCDGDCTLREAISATFSQAGDDTIVFKVTGVINLTRALPSIESDLTLDGPGANLLAVRRNTGGEYGIFEVRTPGTVSLSNITINNGAADDGGGIRNLNAGTVNVTSCVLSGNVAGFGGAGINNRSAGTVNITGCTLSGNDADSGGGIENSGGGSVNVANSTITANLARRHGGAGIQNFAGGTVTVVNCVISDNHSQAQHGGGIDNFAGTVNVTDSTINNNVSDFDAGGGIFNAGNLSVTNSTISGNSAEKSGGGVFNGAGGSASIISSTLNGNRVTSEQFGGGGFSNEGEAHVTSSTFAGNSALTDGGAILNSGTATVTNCTISGNTATSTPHSPGNGAGIENAGTHAVQVRSTIIALNTGPGAQPDVSGTFGSAGFNLIGKTTPDTGFTDPTDLTGTVASPLNPRLDPNGLRNNGGPTQTIALLCGSPAVDKGSGEGLSGPLSTDQRGAGFPRKIDDLVTPNAAGGDGADIGAFELTVCNHPPVAQCRNIQVSVGGGCQASIAAADIDNGSFDPDPGDSIAGRALDHTGPFDLGPHSVTLTITDTHGASSSCTATVTVLDTTPPTITCPANIVTRTGPGSAVVVVNYTVPSAVDNCSTPAVVCSPPSGSQFPRGATTVTCLASDAANNAASCSFVVTVFDVCVQDDGTRNTLLFDSQTGDYLFVRCGAGGFTLGGTGSVRIMGNIITLEHNASDHRVSARIDNSQKKGIASAQRFGQMPVFTITDRNTADNSCSCP